MIDRRLCIIGLGLMGGSLAGLLGVVMMRLVGTQSSTSVFALQGARAYQAACTPDFFLFDNNLDLVYRGQLDDSRPGNGLPVTGRNLRQAMDALLAGEPVSSDQKPSIGCNIKWKTAP